MNHRVPLIFGEVLMDCFPGGIELLGGAPFNVAWHLQAFGREPVLVSRVGADIRGEEIRKAMQAWGMSLDGLQVDNNHATGEVSITINDGEPSFDIVADRAYDHIDSRLLPDLEPSLIYHGSLALRNADSARALSMIKSRYSSPVFVDVNLRTPWWDKATLEALLHDARWAKLNQQELEIISPKPATAGIIEHAHSFCEQFELQLLIVTLGAAGALAVDPDGETYHARPVAISGIMDTVGAGDAFASVVILGLLLNWSKGEIMERAQQFASLVVGVRGAVIREKNIYQQLIQQWMNDTR